MAATQRVVVAASLPTFAINTYEPAPGLAQRVVSVPSSPRKRNTRRTGDPISSQAPFTRARVAAARLFALGPAFRTRRKVMVPVILASMHLPNAIVSARGGRNKNRAGVCGLGCSNPKCGACLCCDCLWGSLWVCFIAMCV
jgi:hypothetical protein